MVVIITEVQIILLVVLYYCVLYCQNPKMNNNMNIYDNIKDLKHADSFKDARVFHNDYDDSDIKLTNFGFNMRMSSINISR